jgi:hypothetical protein
MPVRAGMQPLVDRLRKAIGDVGSSRVFEDDDLQAALDERRSRLSAVALLADPVISGSATVFRAPYGFWEADAAIASSSGAVTPDLSDPINGTWAFDAAPGVTLYVTGYAYDLWGTAANLLEEWAGRTALEFDFGTDQQQFDRSQKTSNLLKVAREYGRRAIPPHARGATW